jgi:EpsI family protein
MSILKEINLSPRGWLKTAFFGVLLVLVYRTALSQMVFHGWAREDYSHCYLIPFIVLYLIWERRSELMARPSVPAFSGFAPFAIGIGLYWLGELGGEFYTLYLSFWLVIIGLSWMQLGWGKIRTIGIAWFVMLAMFPFPNFINVRLSLFLQLFSSKLGVWMLRLFGMSAYREGNIIDLGFTRLQVVEACSGLRYVLPLLILSLILAWWFKAKLWKKAVLFLSSIPLAIFLNSFRIAATGVLYNLCGPEAAEGFFHGFSGWLLFLVAMPILYFEMRLLLWDKGAKGRGDEGRGGLGRKDLVPGARGRKGLCSDGVHRPLSERSGRPLSANGRSMASKAITATSAAILILTAGLSHGVNFRDKVPIKRSFSDFPMTISGWTGTRESMEPGIIRALHLSDYFMADYRNQGGRQVELYVAYYESQRKGKTTHSPETCLPGSGWTFDEDGLATISTGGGKPIKVNRTFLKKGDTRELAYFWFPQRGRILTSLFQVKLYCFWDALTRHRTDGALVRLITPVYPEEKPADAERRLSGFASEMVGVLGGYLPS